MHLLADTGYFVEARNELFVAVFHSTKITKFMTITNFLSVFIRHIYRTTLLIDHSRSKNLEVYDPT